MKNPDFYLAPTVVGLGKSNLEKRIISIMRFKKPTTLTIVLSAILVGICGTAAFAVAPKTEVVTVSELEPDTTASDFIKPVQKVWTQREILADKAAANKASKAYQRFISTLEMGASDYIYPDSYGGAYITEDYDLIFLVAADGFSEYQYLQDEFPCVKFRKVDNSLNYLQSLADKYIEECSNSDTWYYIAVDVENNRVYVNCDKKTVALRSNNPKYSLFNFELGSGNIKYL